MYTSRFTVRVHITVVSVIANTYHKKNQHIHIFPGLLLFLRISGIGVWTVPPIRRDKKYSMFSELARGKNLKVVRREITARITGTHRQRNDYLEMLAPRPGKYHMEGLNAVTAFSIASTTHDGSCIIVRRKVVQYICQDAQIMIF